MATDGHYSATKIRNAIKRAGYGELWDMTRLKNHRLNGAMDGCSGFIVSDNGRVAYVMADFDPCHVSGPIMYRTSPSVREFSSGHGMNHYTTLDNIGEKLSDMFDNDREWKN